MDSLEQDLRDLRLAEQDIFKQTLSDKQEEIRKLKEENRVLRDLVNSLVVAPRPQPQAARAQGQGAARGREAVPLRWKSS